MGTREELGKGKKLAISRLKTAPVVKGRRHWINYRELGATGASNGHMRAQVMTNDPGQAQANDWHYHTCDLQFLLVLNGWMELEIAGEGLVHLDKGDSIFLPGGTVHHEVDTSEDFELLEISEPAELGTVPCAEPPGALGLPTGPVAKKQ